MDDPGRISRLARGLSIALPDKKVAPSGTLFTKPRQVHRHFVDHVVKKEKAWMFQGVLREPLTDEAIAAILEREYGGWSHFSQHKRMPIIEEMP